MHCGASARHPVSTLVPAALSIQPTQDCVALHTPPVQAVPTATGVRAHAFEAQLSAVHSFPSLQSAAARQPTQVFVAVLQNAVEPEH